MGAALGRSSSPLGFRDELHWRPRSTQPDPEEVIYLKVKLWKEGSVPRSEYVWLRDRLQDLKARANAQVGRLVQKSD